MASQAPPKRRAMRSAQVDEDISPPLSKVLDAPMKLARPRAVDRKPHVVPSVDHDVDSLSEQLRYGLKIGEAMKSSRPRTVSKVRVANQLHSGHEPNKMTKPKTNRIEDVSVEEKKVTAMREVNAASQRLSALVQAEWKASAVRKSGQPTVANVTALAAAARGSLNLLRGLDPAVLNVERAASSVVGKLVALEMHENALDLLRDMQMPIASLYTHNETVDGKTKAALSPSHVGLADCLLLSLPLPQSSADLEPVLQSLISAYFSHIIAVLSALLAPQAGEHVRFVDALLGPGTLLSWITHFPALPTKNIDSVLKRAYVAVATSFTSPLTSSLILLRLRNYALRCLLRTSTLDANSFWEQTLKFASAYIKNTEEGEAQAAWHLIQAFQDVVADAENRGSLLEGRGWITFCEYWMAIAKKAGDDVSLSRVATYIHCSASPSTKQPKEDDDAPGVTAVDSDSVALEVSKLCVTFGQNTVLLERLVDGTVLPDLNELRNYTDASRDAMQRCRRILHVTKPKSTASETKLRRAVEKLRRIAVKVLSESNTERKTLQAVMTLIQSIVDLLEHVLQKVEVCRPDESDLRVSALDSLFTLATTTLSTSDANSWSTAYDILASASRVISGSEKIPHDNKEIEDKEQANYLRCVSGAFFNLAGTLYKAGRYAPAVRFLKEACLFGERALELRGEVAADDKGKRRETEDGSEREADSWKQLKAQLYKRWELLGVCYTKIGDRKLAYAAFTTSVKRFPFSSGFEELLQTSPSPSVFSLPAYHQLGSLIDRLTYIGAAELFLQRDVSLLQPLQAAGVSNLCVATILEQQIKGLDSSKWKPAIRDVVRALLKDLLSVFGHEHPLRRARALVKCLEHAYFAEDEDMHVAEMAQNAIGLLSSNDFLHDAAIARHRSQYMASSYLWLSLHAHRRPNPNDPLAILHHATMACSVLREDLAIALAPSPNAPRCNSVGGPKKGKSVSKKVTPQSRRAPKVALKAPTTPKLKAKSVGDTILETPPKPVTQLESKGHTIDDFEGFVSLLRAVSQLLGLLGHSLAAMQLLDITRRFCEKYGGPLCEAHIRASVDLAQELVVVGRTRLAASIYGHTLNLVRAQSPPAASESAVVFFLRYAESLALLGNASKSSAIYAEALALSQLISEDKATSSSDRIRQRVALLERTALAATVYATIHHAKDDTVTSLDGLLQALRLLNRASDTLERLHPFSKQDSTTDAKNPFDMSRLQDTLPLDTTNKNGPAPSSAPAAVYCKISLDGLEWRIAHGLLNVLLALSQAFFTRGSAREAEYFAQQAEDLANTLRLPAVSSRAIARKSEVQLHLGQLDDAHYNLAKASVLLQNAPGADAAEVQRLRGDYCHKSRLNNDARGMYAKALDMLGELEAKFDKLGTLSVMSPRKPNTASPNQALQRKEMCAPSVLASVLRQQLWLLREDAGDEYETVMEKFLALPQSPDIQTESNALLGRLALFDIHGRFRADMFLSSLAESTIALPMGMSCEQASTPAPHEILGALAHAQTLFESGLGTFASRGRASHVREAAVSLALVRAFQTSLGGGVDCGSRVAAGLLDMAAAVTLRREMIEAIAHKTSDLHRRDDVEWPTISNASTPVRVSIARPRHDPDASVDLSDDEEDSQDDHVRRYWEFIRKKYKMQKFVADGKQSDVDHLPDHWVVVNITVTDDRSTLLVSRQRAGHEPLLFCVPLKGRRDSDDDEHLTFEGALSELKVIIDANDQGTRRAVHIARDDRDGKAGWWAERKLLDQRLKELLENIEFCWLGAFKTILSEPAQMSSDILAALRSRLEKVFRPVLGTQGKKLMARLRLDDALLECISALPPAARDEELEDLVYFVLDLYHFHGVPVALAEVDVDQVALDLRSALEEHHSRARGNIFPVADNHTFLVLDRNIQGLPWESLPALRGRSVSRIPGISFLLDRLHLARAQRGMPLDFPAQEHEEEKIDRAMVDPMKGYYVLNPSGDLESTEGRFKSWVGDMAAAGWEGVIGKPPSEQQLLNALERKDLVVYFGHGGAEQYVRSHKIRHLPRCAATMLWGCSSGALRDMGDFDRTGTPYNYMLAGCPTLVANIWDVTDRAIDNFSLSVFSKLHLSAANARKWKNGHGGQRKAGGTSLVAAVAQSREECKLKYLTGAAVVVYGVPFYL